MAFKDRLKEARLFRGLTQEQVATQIGVAKSTFTGYEKGNSEPNMLTISKIMNVLKTDANFLWQDEMHDLTYKDTATQEEFENIIKKYRSLDPFGQETVSITLDRECKRVELIKKQQDRITYLEENPIVVEKEKDTIVRLYTYMHKIASAGNGFYFDDIPTDTMEAPYLPGADFIIGVNGDSMEPTYSDGDLVYVEKRQIIEVGEIGVFILNNECFIKEAGEKGLVSHNEKYAIIPGSEKIQCIGKVLGKVEMN